ncbi:hypothetical protein RUND412_010695 [Rhizina undulata]
MDYSTMSNAAFGNSAFGNSAFANSLFDNSTATNPDRNKEKRFYDWHLKQGIAAPQDYSLFASQPAPFSTVPQNPNVPTAASPFIQKSLNQQPVGLGSAMDGDSYGLNEMPEGRRKSTMKKTTSSSPPNSPGANWPKSMFGTRPPSRTRNRNSSTTEENSLHAADNNLPPLASIYDSLPFDPTPVETKPSETTFTPTQVRVANYSEDRFPDLIRALRRYYGVILETYSGLPENESKFHDPEIIPHEQLDLKTLRMTQPLTLSEGGPGNWVRITFKDRESAERAVSGSEKGELVIGGRTIIISYWNAEPIVDIPLFPSSSLSTVMDIDVERPSTPKRTSTAPPMGMTPTPIRRVASAYDDNTVFPTTSDSFPAEVSATVSSTNAGTAGSLLYSEHMPGAKLIAPRQVEFAKKEGWFSGWTNSLSAPKVVVGRGTQSGAQSDEGWGLGGLYRYVMDDLIGMKRL